MLQAPPPALAQVPIQNLITIQALLPRLRTLGVRDVKGARNFLEHSDKATRAFSTPELGTLQDALQSYEKEQAFCQTFKWELLAYSGEIQAAFAKQSLEVFETPFSTTRLVYLSIPTRTLRALEQAQLDTVGDVLRAQEDLMTMRNLGQRSVGELFRILGQFARVYRYMLGKLWSSTERRLTPPLLVRAIITPLKERERDVINKRYGLDGKELTLRETGDALGISRERARQIQNRTMEKLREGTSLALIHDWVELHLPHMLHRTLVQMGGLATSDQLCRKVASIGFSLSLIADILQKPLDGLLEQQNLARVGEELWAITPTMATLARDTHRAFGLLPTSSIGADEAQIFDWVRSRFHSDHQIAKRFPPSDRFLRVVRQNLPYFD